MHFPIHVPAGTLGVTLDKRLLSLKGMIQVHGTEHASLSWNPFSLTIASNYFHLELSLQVLAG